MRLDRDRNQTQLRPSQEATYQTIKLSRKQEYEKAKCKKIIKTQK
jgi:hypothetical protein